MKNGNKVLLEHRGAGRAVRLFKGAGGEVQYLREFNTGRPRLEVGIRADNPWAPALRGNTAISG